VKRNLSQNPWYILRFLILALKGNEMTEPHEESFLEKLGDKLRDAVGLPPGKYPDGEIKPSSPSSEPTGTLTSEDAEGLPPHQGTGIAPEE
jgi:hypothetical protein